MSKLITDPATIWLAIKPVDMRRGIDGLSMIAQQALGKVPSAGAALDVSRYPSICLVLSFGTNPNLASVGAVAVT